MENNYLTILEIGYEKFLFETEDKAIEFFKAISKICKLGYTNFYSSVGNPLRNFYYPMPEDHILLKKISKSDFYKTQSDAQTAKKSIEELEKLGIKKEKNEKD